MKITKQQPELTKEDIESLFTELLLNQTRYADEYISIIAKGNSSIALCFYFSSWLNAKSTSRDNCYLSDAGLGRMCGITRNGVRKAMRKFSDVLVRVPVGNDLYWRLAPNLEKIVMAEKGKSKKSKTKPAVKTSEVKTSEVSTVKINKFSDVKDEILQFINRNDIFECDEYFHLMIEKLGYESKRPTNEKSKNAECNAVNDISSIQDKYVIHYLELYAELLSTKAYKPNDGWFSTFCDFCKKENGNNRIGELVQKEEHKQNLIKEQAKEVFYKELELIAKKCISKEIDKNDISDWVECSGIDKTQFKVAGLLVSRDLFRDYLEWDKTHNEKKTFCEDSYRAFMKQQLEVA